MKLQLNLKNQYNKHQIRTAIQKINRYRKKTGAEIITCWEIIQDESQSMEKTEAYETSDHPPCAECGSIFFLRTGTCFVCQTCGSSQGCS